MDERLGTTHVHKDPGIVEDLLHTLLASCQTWGRNIQITQFAKMFRTSKTTRSTNHANTNRNNRKKSTPTWDVP
jgi:hypothetical protein